jgi:hypothetical protein
MCLMAEGKLCGLLSLAEELATPVVISLDVKMFDSGQTRCTTVDVAHLKCCWPRDMLRYIMPIYIYIHFLEIGWVCKSDLVMLGYTANHVSCSCVFQSQDSFEAHHDVVSRSSSMMTALDLGKHRKYLAEDLIRISFLVL